MARIDHYRNPNAPKPNSLVVAVSAFVQDDEGRILLIRRTDNDLYALPGGGVELGETMTQAVHREVMEETGIEVEVTGLIGIFSDPEHLIEFTNGEVRQEFSICFHAAPVGGHPQPSVESKEVTWTPASHLDELNIHPSIHLRIRYGLDARPEPHYS